MCGRGAWPVGRGGPAPSLAAWLATRLPGYYGWIIVAIGGLGLLCSGPGQSAVIAIFIDPMIAELGLSHASIAAAYTVGNLVAAAAMGPIGRLTDRVGGQIVLALGAAGLGLACLVMSRAGDLVVITLGFSALRLLVQGPFQLTGTTLVAQWFVRRRGRAQSLMALGMTASFAIFPALTALLVERLTWRPAWVAIGLLIWLVLLPPILLLVRSHPEELGLRPDGERLSEPVVAAAHSTTTEEAAWTARQATRTATFWLLSAAIAVTWLVGAGLNFHQVSILVSQGHSPTFAAGLFTVAAVVSIPATFLGGYVLDRYPTRPVLLVMLLIQVAAAWTLLGAADASVALLYGALNGAMIGLSSVVNAVIFAIYYGRRHLGSIRGITMIVNVAASALGALPLGLARDLLGRYDLALILLGLLPLLMALTLPWVRPPVGRR